MGCGANDGGGTAAIGCSDHQSSGSVSTVLAESGHTAPASIHAWIFATSAALSASPSGGIRMSSTSPLIYLSSGLAAAWPGTMFGALPSPPVRAIDFTSSR